LAGNGKIRLSGSMIFSRRDIPDIIAFWNDCYSLIPDDAFTGIDETCHMTVKRSSLSGAKLAFGVRTPSDKSTLFIGLKYNGMTIIGDEEAGR